MPRERKTIDEFDIEANYGYGDGWEVVTCEPTAKEARERIKEYRVNEARGTYRIRKHRVSKIIPA